MDPDGSNGRATECQVPTNGYLNGIMGSIGIAEQTQGVLQHAIS